MYSFVLVPRVGDLSFTKEECLNASQFDLKDDVALDLSDDVPHSEDSDNETHTPRLTDTRYVFCICELCSLEVVFYWVHL